MSDRYYAQMSKALGIAPWELKIQLRDPERFCMENKKVTRLSLSKELSKILNTEVDARKLALPTLSFMLESCKKKNIIKVEMPTGNRKLPYMEALRVMFNKDLDLDTATIKVMRSIIEAVNSLGGINE